MAGEMRSGSPLDQPKTDRLRSLAALHHVARDPLSFRQLADASAVQSRCTHKNVLAAAVADDEAEPFVGGIELDRAGLLDHGLIVALLRPLGPGTPWRFVKRGAGIDTEEFGDLLALLPRPDPNLKRGAWRHSTVAAALDDADVQEGVTAGRKLYEAEALLGVVPLHRCRNRRAGRSRFK